MSEYIKYLFKEDENLINQNIASPSHFGKKYRN